MCLGRKVRRSGGDLPVLVFGQPGAAFDCRYGLQPPDALGQSGSFPAQGFFMFTSTRPIQAGGSSR